MEERRKAPCPEICLAVVWHQHQPYYWDLTSDELVFPWVRLHGTKDYYDMASRLQRFPGIRQTFNLVPSLLEQIEAYVDGRVTDRYWTHSAIPAGELNTDQKTFILQRFFDANEENLIRPYQRYAQLKQKRDEEGLEKARKQWSPQDLRDLQTWFNLAWIDPSLRQSDPLLKDLEAKGKDFTEAEKQTVLSKHLEILREVLPLHRRLQDSGGIEVTTTPFFHPILPLLCDSNEARDRRGGFGMLSGPSPQALRRWGHR
jgi:alpha-amylase/alpha-mannosidase (GH57 family)